jgi:hypothetical protein
MGSSVFLVAVIRKRHHVVLVFLVAAENEYENSYWYLVSYSWVVN